MRRGALGLRRRPSRRIKTDIGKVLNVKSSFGPDFAVTEVEPTGIDPKLLTGQKLPDGLKFEPSDCAKFATGQVVPPGTEGNMAAVSAEGRGNRYIVIAVETNGPIPATEPGKDCQKVSFAGGALRGTVEVVDAPKVAGAQTLGVHRVLQTVVNGQTRTGEVFNYVARFGITRSSSAPTRLCSRTSRWRPSIPDVHANCWWRPSTRSGTESAHRTSRGRN